MKFSYTLLQPIYSKLLSLSLRGLNYNNIDFDRNGERYFIETLQKKYKRTKTSLNIMDVGAHHGHYSILLSKLLQEQKIPHKIFASEPLKKNFNILKNNTSKNQNIICINSGIGIKNEKSKIYSPAENTTLTSVFNRKIKLFNNLVEEEINLISIDTFVIKEEIANIHFFKIDVEGNELNVLQGAQNTLSKHLIHHIPFEFGGTALDANIHLKDFSTLFSKNKYQYGRLLTKGIQKYSEYNINLEL